MLEKRVLDLVGYLLLLPSRSTHFRGSRSPASQPPPHRPHQTHRTPHTDTHAPPQHPNQTPDTIQHPSSALTHLKHPPTAPNPPKNCSRTITYPFRHITPLRAPMTLTTPPHHPTPQPTHGRHPAEPNTRIVPSNPISSHPHPLSHKNEPLPKIPLPPNPLFGRAGG